jgi:hypothetical protein
MIILRVITVTVITALCVWRLRCTILSTPRRECRLPSHTSNRPLAPQQEAIPGLCLSGAAQVASRIAAPVATTNGTARMMAFRVAVTGTEAIPLPVAIDQGRAAGLPYPTWTGPGPQEQDEGASPADFVPPLVRSTNDLVRVLSLPPRICRLLGEILVPHPNAN